MSFAPSVAWLWYTSPHSFFRREREKLLLPFLEISCVYTFRATNLLLINFRWKLSYFAAVCSSYLVDLWQSSNNWSLSHRIPKRSEITFWAGRPKSWISLDLILAHHYLDHFLYVTDEKCCSFASQMSASLGLTSFCFNDHHPLIIFWACQQELLLKKMRPVLTDSLGSDGYNASQNALDLFLKKRLLNNEHLQPNELFVLSVWNLGICGLHWFSSTPPCSWCHSISWLAVA